MTQRTGWAPLAAIAAVLWVGAGAQAQPTPPTADPADEPVTDDTAEPGADPFAEPEPAPEPVPEPAAEPEPAPAPTTFDASIGASASATAEAPPEATASAAADVPEADVGPPPDEEEIVITGSRIKRSAFSSTAPVAVMTRKDIDASGAHNMTDLIQNLTVAAGSGFLGANEGESLGTARVNLRGLGGGATLVLINGRRTVPSAAGVTVAFTDISTIPLAVVERIEILKSGASALYGTDAIAGVINIITRKDWEGLKFQVDGRGTTRGFDYREGTASLAIGATGERGRVLVGLQYFRSNQLLASDRDFTAKEGPAGGQGGNWSLIGHPGTFITATGLQPDPSCADAPGSRVADSGLCEFSFRAFRHLTPDTERASAFGYGEFDISEYTKAFLEVNVSRTRAENISSPSFRVLGNPVVPADHIDNPFGQDVGFVGRPLGAASGGVTQSNDDDTFRTAMGIQGDFGGLAPNTMFADWGWELVATFGVSRYQRFLPDELGGPFAAAINSCSDPSDLSGCFNPFYSAIDGTGTPNSDEVIKSFTGALMSTVDQQLQTYGAGINGTLFGLPGGDMGFALGGELRREQRSAQLDHDSNEFDLAFYFGDDDGYADRDILAGYAELLFPVLMGLELQTAARVESYSEGWSTFNPFAGMTINVGDLTDSSSDALSRLVLRANVSRAFRAPALFQSFNGSTTVPRSLDAGGTAPVYVPVRRVGNPDLEPEEATVFTAGLSWKVGGLSLEADYWRYAYENYIAPENEQQILTTALQTGTDDPRLQFGPGMLLERVTVAQINTPGTITTHGLDAKVNYKLETAAGSFSLGVDGMLMFAYLIPRELVPKVPTDDGPQDPDFCSGDTCDVAGKFNEANIAGPLPTWRMNIPLTWEMDEHLAGFMLHVMSPLEDWSPARYGVTPEGYRKIDPFITLDFQYALTLGNVIGRLTKLRVGLLNLLDQAPPFVDTIDSFSTQLHDPRGRMVYASLSQEL